MTPVPRPEVADPTLGLSWKKRAERGNDGELIRLSWNTALLYAKQQGGGWRLPTVEELMSLIRFDEAGRMTLRLPLEAAKNWYWTSTPALGDEDFAWMVYFDSGAVGRHYRSEPCCVRLVRPLG